MRPAIIAVRKHVMGLQQASNNFNVPKSTLKDKVNSNEEDLDKLVRSKLGRESALPDELETALVSYCADKEERFYGLTTKYIKRTIFQLACKSNLNHPFSKNNETAGWKWLHKFMGRHQELSLWKPQCTSTTRIRSFNQKKIDMFFNIYEPVMDIISHSPTGLFNCDETGLTVIQHKVNRGFSLKGKC